MRRGGPGAAGIVERNGKAGVPNAESRAPQIPGDIACGSASRRSFQQETRAAKIRAVPARTSRNGEEAAMATTPAMKTTTTTVIAAVFATSGFAVHRPRPTQKAHAAEGKERYQDQPSSLQRGRVRGMVLSRLRCGSRLLKAP